MLAQLDTWVAEHGTADVPQGARTTLADGESYWLGKRVSEARIAYRRGTLNPTMAKELDQRHGWVWHAYTARWQQNLQRLTAHLEDGGTLTDAPPRLRHWLQEQRDRDDLQESQRNQLAAIPGALDPGDLAVRRFVAAAYTWLAQDPDRDMAQLTFRTTVHHDGEDIPLGKRATYYRRRHAALEGTHPLPDRHVAMIGRLPGWRWREEASTDRSVAR